MGFSVIASTAIIFSCLIATSSVFYTSVIDTFDDVEDGVSDQHERLAAQEQTDIEIIFLFYNRTSNNLTITVKNKSGNTITLDPSLLDVLLNGEIVTVETDSLRVDGADTNVWSPEETLRMNITDVDLKYYTDVDQRVDQTVTTNLTSARNVSASSVTDRIGVIDNNTHIDIFDLNGSFKFTISPAGTGSTEVELFYDGFEDGTYNAWDAIPGNDWGVTNANPNIGSRHSIVDDTDGAAGQRYLTKSVSTVGYEDISFIYYRCARDLEADDHVYAQWNDGNGWNTLEDFTDGSSGENSATYVNMDFSLPSTADNNPNFQIRFDAILDAPDDDFDLDEVKILGSTTVSNLNDLSLTDYIYVVNETTNILRYDMDGTGQTELISNGGQLTAPAAISVTSDLAADYIYILDNNDHIDRYDLSGNYIDTPITSAEVDSPQDIYVTGEYVYVIDYDGTDGYHVDRFSLAGVLDALSTSITNLASPTDIAVSDEDFTEEKIYIVYNSAEVRVYDSDGSYNSVVTSGMSENVHGIDVTGPIFVTDEINGLLYLNLGTIIKIVTENGVWVYETI